MHLKVNDLFPDWLSGEGIFSAISGLSGYTPPWSSSMSDLSLDLEYHGNRSGSKKISPLFFNFVDLETDPPSIFSTDVDKLALIIVSMYSANWSKLYATLSFDYNPINNYDMTEELDETEANTGTVNNVSELTHGEEISNSGTVGKESTVAATQGNSLYGFNSSSAVPSDSQTGSNEGSETETRNLNEAHSGSDTQEDTRTDNLAKTNEHTLTRKGNIGVTTTQQMIQAERNLWQWKFFDQVFSDVDRVLTIPVY